MGRPLRALALTLLVAACGGQRSYEAPRELDDACRILDERPAYARAFAPPRTAGASPWPCRWR
jgi:hypothetical protein